MNSSIGVPSFPRLAASTVVALALNAAFLGGLATAPTRGQQVLTLAMPQQERSADVAAPLGQELASTAVVLQQQARQLHKRLDHTAAKVAQHMDRAVHIVVQALRTSLRTEHGGATLRTDSAGSF